MFASTSLRRLLPGAAVLLLLALSLTGCEEGSVTAPEIEQGGDDNTLFRSYVALGNSITAGFQSGGIVDTTQEASYAALLAEQMNTPFGIPALNKPGCPPPFVRFFDDNGVPVQERPSGTTAETCALRASQIPERVNNVALPFAAAADATSNETGNERSANFAQFFLGGRTMAQAAQDLNPTFATVWLGNNDVLGPATEGSAVTTPQATFEDEYTQMLDSLEAPGTLKGGVLVGVTNVTFTPFFSPGPVYFALSNLPPSQNPFPPNFDVASNCDAQDPNTGLTPLVPLSFGFGLIGQAQANPGQTITLDCGAADTGVLTLTEVGSLVQTVRQYNAFIQQEAQDRGLAYYNPNGVLQQVYQANNGTPQVPTDDPIPKFPDTDAAQPFGPFFSLDGVHPSDATHRLVASELVGLINSPESEGGYGADLPAVENVPALP
jgi:lysophospholipase L1-like esterase